MNTIRVILIVGLAALCAPLWGQGGASTRMAGSFTGGGAPVDLAAMLGEAGAIVPRNAEVLASLDMRRLVDSGLLDKVLDKKSKREQTDAFVAFIEQVSGANLRRDIQRVFLYGRLDDKEFGGLIVQGRFDREKLVTLARMNAKYESLTVAGQIVHQWWDDKKDKMNYGAFLADDSLVIWDSERGRDAALEALQHPDRRLDPAEMAGLAPTGDNIAWGLVLTRSDSATPIKLQATSAAGLLDFEGDTLTLAMLVNPANPEAREQWRKTLEGAVALGALQREHARLAEIANRAQVTELPSGAVLLESMMDLQTAFDLADELD